MLPASWIPEYVLNDEPDYEAALIAGLRQAVRPGDMSLALASAKRDTAGRNNVNVTVHHAIVGERSGGCHARV